MVDHVMAKTLDEALKTMKKGTYKPIAGGTDLMVKHRSWANTPPEFDNNMLYLDKLDELKKIKAHETHLEIGSLTPYETIMDDERTPDMLKQCIRELASPALRHVATLAGNIANASPAADAVLVLIALDATASIQSADAKREVLVGELIQGPGKTGLEADELIVSIMIPSHSFTHTLFKKVGGRKADAISKLAFAGGARVEEGVLKDLNIALNAVGPVIVRDPRLEESYIDKSVETLKADVDTLIEKFDASITPIDDQRSNKHYRRKVAHNLIRRFIDTL